MKKLLCAIFAIAVLAGCSSDSGGTKETKTCSIEMDPITMDITFNATDDKIETTSIKVSMDYSSLGIEEGTGVEVSTDFSDGTLAATVDIDLKEGDSSTLEALGFGAEGEYLLSDTVKAAEEGGATCK